MVSLGMCMSYSSRADSHPSRKCAGEGTTYTQEPLLVSPHYPTPRHVYHHHPILQPNPLQLEALSIQILKIPHALNFLRQIRIGGDKFSQRIKYAPIVNAFSTKSCFAILHMELNNKIHLIQGICLFDYTS